MSPFVHVAWGTASGEVSKRVQVNGDNGSYVTGASGYFSNTDNLYPVYDNVLGSRTFLRFPDLAIPEGAVITSATITVYSPGVSTWDNDTLDVYVREADNGGTITTDTAFTTAYAERNATPVEWNINKTVALYESTTSPDLSGLVQAVVNRGGWASGNAITFFTDTDYLSGNHRWYSLANGSAGDYEALLEVEYSGGTASTSEAALRIAGDGDNGSYVTGAGGWFSNSDNLYPVYGDALGSRTFLRWPLGIPNGATINSAVITAYSVNVSTWDNDTLDVYVREADNGGTITTDTAFTTAYAEKNTTPIEWGVNKTTQASEGMSSPDLKTLLQAIVNRVGWASGNYVTFFTDTDYDGGAHRWYSYNNGTAATYVLLEVEWTA